MPITLDDLYIFWLKKFLHQTDNNHMDIKNLIKFLMKLTDLKNKNNLSIEELTKIQLEIESKIFKFKEVENLYNLVSISNGSEIEKIYKDFDEAFIKSYSNSVKFNKKNYSYEELIDQAKLKKNFFMGLFFYELSSSLHDKNYFLNTLISKLTVALKNNFLKKKIIEIEFEMEDYVSIAHSLISAAESVNIIKLTENNSFQGKNKKVPKLWYFENEILKNHIMIISSLLNIQLPMIVRPMDWKSNESNDCYYFGGFLASKNYTSLSFDLTSSISKTHVLENISNDYINSINYLQSQGFIINTEYVDYLLNLPFQEIEKEFILEVYDKQLGYSKEITVNLLNYVNDKVMPIEESTYCFKIFFTIFVIQILKGFTLYFVYFIDFRSRIYPYGYPLTFYSAKIFRKCFISKKADYFDESYFNKNFLKYFDEYDKFTKLSYQVLSKSLIGNFLIGMDACASAFQIQGALLKDLKMMQLTNIYNNDTNKKYDIYFYIMHGFKDYVLNNNYIKFNDYDYYLYEAKDKFSELSYKITDLKSLFLLMCEDRKFWKSIIIPFSYNEGSKSRVEKFKAYFLDKLNNSYNKKLYEFSDIVESLFSDFFNSEFPKYKTLKLIFNFLLKGNTESFIIKNNYFKLKQFYPVQEKVEYYRRRANKKPLHYTFMVSNYNKLNKTKQRCASYVNFIHSLDASIMVNVINRFKKENLNIFPVHDCFYVNPSYMERVIKTYNVAFIEEIIFNNPLKKLFLSNNFDFLNKKMKKYLTEIGYFDNWSEDDLLVIKNSLNSLKP